MKKQDCKNRIIELKTVIKRVQKHIKQENRDIISLQKELEKLKDK